MTAGIVVEMLATPESSRIGKDRNANKQGAVSVRRRWEKEGNIEGNKGETKTIHRYWILR
jgi:hypothetical protein